MIVLKQLVMSNDIFPARVVYLRDNLFSLFSSIMLGLFKRLSLMVFFCGCNLIGKLQLGGNDTY